MMHPKYMMKTIIIHIICISLLFQCSLVGFTVGRAVDSSNPNYKFIDKIDKGELYTLEPEKKIKITFFDGRFIEGNYLDLKKDSMEEYTSKYVKQRKNLLPLIYLPELQDTLLIISKAQPEKTYLCLFLGFEYNQILLKAIEADTLLSAPLQNLNKRLINQDSEFFDLETILELMSKGRIPLKSSIILQNSSSEYLFPLETIREIQLAQISYNTTKTLFFGGLAIDIILFLGFLVVRAGLSSLD